MKNPGYIPGSVSLAMHYLTSPTDISRKIFPYLLSYTNLSVYRRLHVPVNALVQNMFSRDVKRLRFEVFPPKCEVLLLNTAQREDDSNEKERTKLSERRPTFNDLRNQVKELAQDYSSLRSWAKNRVQFQKSLSTRLHFTLFSSGNVVASGKPLLRKCGSKRKIHKIYGMKNKSHGCG